MKNLLLILLLISKDIFAFPIYSIWPHYHCTAVSYHSAPYEFKVNLDYGGKRALIWWSKHYVQIFHLYDNQGHFQFISDYSDKTNIQFNFDASNGFGKIYDGHEKKHLAYIHCEGAKK